MFSKSQLLDAIEGLEASPATFQNAEKLAVFYQLYDHLYAPRIADSNPVPTGEVTIYKYGGSEFLEAIGGQDAEEVWKIIDELMTAIKALNPRLYNATLDRIRGL